MATLISLLEQTLLLEGRLQKVLKKYEGKISPEVVQKLSDAQKQIDPKINNKYLEWMIKQYINGYSIEQIVKGIEIWHNNNHKIDTELITNRYPDFNDNPDLQKIIKNPRDINSYKNLDLLIQIGNDAKNELSKSERNQIIQSETRLIYDDDRYQIRVPLTHRASCKYGRGAAWCTRLPDTDKFFIDYTERGILFYIIDKTMSSRVDHPLYKIAVWMDKESGYVEIWNARNKKIGSDLSYYFPPEMVKVMNDYRKRYVINMIERNKQINAQLGKLGGEIQGWKLTTDGEYGILVREPYKIKIDVTLNRYIINLSLIYNQNVISKLSLDGPIQIMQELEDTLIDFNNDESKLNQYYQKLFNFIQQNWNKIINRFQPNIRNIDIFQLINAKIQKVTGKWKFVAKTIPTEENQKIVFESIRSIPSNNNEAFKYTLLLIIDLVKQQFILKAEEENMSTHQISQYEDQILSFSSDLLSDPNTFVKEFLSWAKDILALAYTEDESIELGDNNLEELQKLTGKYRSERYGDFIVELDDENQLHVYSKKTGAHYLFTNVQSFINNVLNKYQLQKISK